MRAWRTLLAAGVLSVAWVGWAAEPPADGPLAGLAWTVGGTWVAEVKDSGGQPMRAETKFDWAEHGRTLKFAIHFKTATGTVTQYEGVYFWHPGKRQIQMLQVDRNGNVTESVAKVDGAALTQENQVTLVDGTTRSQRVSVTREGDDAFAFKAMVQRDGQWVDAVGFTYRRER